MYLLGATVPSSKKCADKVSKVLSTIVSKQQLASNLEIFPSVGNLHSVFPSPLSGHVLAWSHRVVCSPLWQCSNNLGVTMQVSVGCPRMFSPQQSISKIQKPGNQCCKSGSKHLMVHGKATNYKPNVHRRGASYVTSVSLSFFINKMGLSRRSCVQCR